MKKECAFVLIFCLILSFKFALAQQTPSQGSVEQSLQEFASLLKSIAIVGAVLMIVLSGLEWMTSLGNPSKIGAAKERIYTAILGLLIVALAEIIAALVGAK
jgi:hypothetical protein